MERTRLYLITPAAIDLASFVPKVKDAFSGGDVASLQLRLKGASDDEVLKAAEQLLPICREHEAAFIINDRPDLAKKAGADGVHVGHEDATIAEARAIIGNDLIIGATCHDSRHLAMEAGEQGADYVAFGAFYPTTSKNPEYMKQWGTPTPDILSWWQEYMTLPVVAIGGITPANCAPLVKAGADFIAVIQAVWNHETGPAKAVEAFNEAIGKAV